MRIYSNSGTRDLCLLLVCLQRPRTCKLRTSTEVCDSGKLIENLDTVALFGLLAEAGSLRSEIAVRSAVTFSAEAERGFRCAPPGQQSA
jgi:hypothetical protein